MCHNELLLAIPLFFILKLIILWNSVKLTRLRPVLTCIGIVFLLIIVYGPLAATVSDLPKQTNDMVKAILIGIPLVTPLLSVWCYKKWKGDFKPMVIIIGVLDLILTGLYFSGVWSFFTENLFDRSL
ncbi:MAG: hypothetical protein SFY67_01245 [Candidatus Melainabacteria bacterium]|nr:hypothetical protein [Candidatus Melainabacteria bacterium]